MDRKRIQDWYIKDDGSGRPLMSGRAIPRDADGITRNIDFVNCVLHPASHGVFENCAINGHSFPDGAGCLYDLKEQIYKLR